MRILFIFMFGLYITLTVSKPLQQAEENDREDEEAEYEDDNAQEYVQDNRQSPSEVQRSYDDHENSQMEEEHEEAYAETNGETSGNNNNQQHLDGDDNIERNIRNEKNDNALSEKKRINIYRDSLRSEDRGFHLPSPNRACKSGEAKNLRYLQQENESGDLLFKRHRVRSNENINNAYLSSRDRRQVQDVDSTGINVLKNQESDNNMGEALESVVKKDIKDLSTRDLEELLGSLSQEKVAILKKMIYDNENINKREISKQASVVEDKQNELYSSLSTDSPNSNVDTTESNKQTESSESSNSKSCDSGNGSTKSNSANLLYKNHEQSKSDMGVVSLEDQSQLDNNLSADVKETKNENKRDTNLYDNSNFKNMYEDSKEQNIKTNEYKESSVEQDLRCIDDQDWLEEENNYEPHKLVNYNSIKRDVSKENIPDVPNSIKSLEESFPSINSDGINLKSDLTPLVRVKRTFKKHGDVNQEIDIPSEKKISISSENQNSDVGLAESNEFQNYNQNKYLLIDDRNRNKDQQKCDCNLQRRGTPVNSKHFIEDQNNQNLKMKSDMGSNLYDNYLTNDGVNVNGIRKKRMYKTDVKNIDNYDNSLSCNGQMIENDLDTVSEKNDNVSQQYDVDNIGPSLHNKDVNRYKRIRQIKETT